MTARSLLAACWIVSAGCVLLDERELEVRPEGTLFAGEGGPVRGRDYLLRFEARSSASRVEVFLDGESLGTRPTNRTVELGFRDLEVEGGPSWGEHELTVRESGAPRPREVRRRFVFFPALPRVRYVTPALELAPLDTSLVSLTMSRPPLRDLVTPRTAWLEADGVRLGGEPRVGSDGVTITLELPAPLRAYGEVTAVLSRNALYGAPPVEPQRFTWPGALVEASIGILPDGTRTLVAGEVWLEVAWGTRAPPSVELLAGEHVIATFGPTPPSEPVRWDTREVPDGTYPLRLRAEGYRVHYVADAPTLTVANTPSTGATCTGAPIPTGPIDWMCFAVALDHPATLTRAAFTVAGLELTANSPNEGLVCSTLALTVGSGWRPLDPPVPDAPELGGSAVLHFWTRTDSGVTGEGECNIEWPAWRAPLPDPLPGPVTASAVALLPSEDACSHLAGWCPDGGDGFLLAIGGDGAETGKVRAWALGGAGWESSGILNAMVGSSASDLSGDGWIERVAGGPWLVFQGGAHAPRNLDPSADAASIAVAFSSPDTYTHHASAWSEAAGDGRVVVVNGRALARLDPAAEATQPAVMAPEILFGSEPYQGTFAAWIERPPGGVARVRAATVRPYEEVAPLAGVDNADPSVDASEPTAFAGRGLAIVAWTEGDRIMARTVTESGVGAPEILNADPARVARSPRFDPNGRAPTLYWLETDGSGGDVIRVRRYTGTGWLLHPQAVNESAPGPVQTFDVESHRVVWVDDTGKVHLRYATFPR